MRKRFSAIFNTRAFYLVFSFITAVALWAYVGYGENEDEAVTVNGVLIEYINADDLAEHDLVLTNVDHTSVNLRLSGKRNTVLGLNNKNVSVVVDLAEIVEHSATTGSYQLRCQVYYPDDIDSDDVSVAYSSSDYVSVTVEKLVTATLKIDAIYDGGPAEGYSAQPVELSEDHVTVSGPDSLISQIKKVEARFSAYDFSSEVKQDVPLTLLDSNGTPVATDDLSLEFSSVTAVIPVLMVKEIPLEISFTNCNSADYGPSGNISYKIDPPTVTLSGDAEVLRDINVINLGTIDLMSFNLTYNDVMSIKIPNGVTNMTGTSTADVTVNISGVDITRLSVTTITYKNETNGLYYKIITQSLDVTLRGSEASLAAVAPNNIRIVADLAELGNATGIFSAPAKVYIDGYSDVDATGTYKVTVSASSEPFPPEDADAVEQGTYPGVTGG